MQAFIKRILFSVKWHGFQKFIYNKYKKRLLANLTTKNFTIISNNCWGGFVYQDANLEYLTPTVGLFIHSPCYIKLLQNFDLIYSSLTFTAITKYEATRKLREATKNNYPIGLLNNDIEIHFLHYASTEEAQIKWQRRLKKINPDKLLFLYAARDAASDKTVADFDALPYKNKVCLSTKEFKALPSVTYFPEFKHLAEMPGADIARINVIKRVDILELLNGL